MSSKLLFPDEEFDTFMETIGLGAMPKDDLQYTEMRKGFLAGMMCMFGVMAFKVNEIEDEEEAVAEVQAIFETLKSTPL